MLFVLLGRQRNSAGLGLEALGGVLVGLRCLVELDVLTGNTSAMGVNAMDYVARANLATDGQAKTMCAVCHCVGSGVVMAKEAMEHKPSVVWMILELV